MTVSGHDVVTRVDEFDAIAGSISLRPWQWQLALAFDGTSTVDAVAASCAVDLKSACAAVEALHDHGLVTLEAMTLDDYREQHAGSASAPKATSTPGNPSIAPAPPIAPVPQAVATAPVAAAAPPPAVPAAPAAPASTALADRLAQLREKAARMVAEQKSAPLSAPPTNGASAKPAPSSPDSMLKGIGRIAFSLVSEPAPKPSPTSQSVDFVIKSEGGEPKPD